MSCAALWCPGPESNRYGTITRRRILSPLCLPISPPGHAAEVNLQRVVSATRRQVFTSEDNWRRGSESNQVLSHRIKVHEFKWTTPLPSPLPQGSNAEASRTARLGSRAGKDSTDQLLVGRKIVPVGDRKCVRICTRSSSSCSASQSPSMLSGRSIPQKKILNRTDSGSETHALDKSGYIRTDRTVNCNRRTLTKAVTLDCVRIDRDNNRSIVP